jgi:serpin B
MTHDASFVLLDGERVTVPMMDWESPERVPCTRGEGYQAVELPYAGGKTSLVLIVPDEGEFAAYETALTAEHLTVLLDDLNPESVALTMPKFSYDQDFSLAKTLAAMGMPDAMDPALADFSGMDGARGLYIGNVFHKAFVAVDEAGTEAAAATAVVMLESAMPMDDAIKLTVDRPFIFLIRDTGTGALLFVGRVENPAG